MSKEKSMTPKAASRIQSATERNQGSVNKGSFAARAQSSSAKSAPNPSQKNGNHGKR